MPSDLVNEVAQVKSIRLIVRYHDAVVDEEIQGLESKPQQDREYKAKDIFLKFLRYGELKARVTSKMDNSRLRLERDYSHLSMTDIPHTLIGFQEYSCS